jgi:hypothetical protein
MALRMSDSKAKLSCTLSYHAASRIEAITSPSQCLISRLTGKLGTGTPSTKASTTQLIRGRK